MDENAKIVKFKIFDVNIKMGEIDIDLSLKFSIRKIRKAIFTKEKSR